jgi:hypothetical protein
MKTLLWVAVAAGIFVRAWGLFTDLWLDELWSMNMALSASSPLNLATVYKFKHDNNHILNTVWIYFVGAGRPFYVYRMLAFACGVLSLPLVWSLSRRHGERAAALATMLVATWYQFAHYTSESRGYAPMLFFILLAWWSLDRYLLSATWYHAAIFVSACALGILSHFSFIFALPGFMYLAWINGGWRQVMALNPVPLAFAYAVYDEFVRKMRIGGGPVLGIKGAIDQYSAQTIGLVAVPILVVCIIAIAWNLRREGLVLLVILAAMAGSLMLRKPTYIYGRYFIAFTPFLLILMARWMATWQSGQAVVSILILWVAGQAQLTQTFLHYGRGSYGEAMRYMQATNPGTIGPAYERGLFDSTLIRFYGPRAGAPEMRMSLRRPDWVVLSKRDGYQPTFDLYGGHYVFDRVYECDGIAGTPWFLYRRSDAPSGGDTPPATRAVEVEGRLAQ